MFSAGCTMNIGWKKLPREIAWLFCGVQGIFRQSEDGYFRANAKGSPPGHCHIIFEMRPLASRSNFTLAYS